MHEKNIFNGLLVGLLSLFGILLLVPFLLIAVRVMTPIPPQVNFENGLAADKTKDYLEAEHWYREAAEQGYADAQNNLGIMYYEGRGVIQDYAQAHIWFNIASALGSQNAKKNRRLAERMLTAQEIAEARKEAAKWLEAHRQELR